MTSGGAPADSIINKKGSQAVSGLQHFQKQKELSNFSFLNVGCWLPVWQTVTSEWIQHAVIATNTHSFSPVSMLREINPNRAGKSRPQPSPKYWRLQRSKRLFCPSTPGIRSIRGGELAKAELFTVKKLPFSILRASICL